MSNSDNGCGCLILGGLGLILLACSYPLYDGYINREISSGEYAKVTIVETTFSRHGDNTFATLEIRNESEWVLRSAIVRMTIIPKSGQPKSYTVSAPIQLDAGFDIAPISVINALGIWSFKLPEEAATILAQGDKREVSFKLNTIQGCRRPIKLVKGPIDYIKKLFERE